MDNEDAKSEPINQLLTYRGVRNPYLLLCDEAGLLINLARTQPKSTTDTAIRLSRSAVRSLCFAPEALINLALMHFGEGSLFDWLSMKSNEQRLSTTDKYVLLHELCNLEDSQKIELSIYPFTTLKEIVNIRNAFSHPKASFPIWLSMDNFFNSKETPERVISEFNKGNPDDVYPATGIPYDFSRMTVENADKLMDIVRKIETALVDLFREKALIGGEREWPNNETLKFHGYQELNKKEKPSS